MSDAEGFSGPDPVPEGVRDLVALFAGPLDGVRFPDADRSLLASAVKSVEAADAEVHRLVADLEAARAQLAENQTALEKLAARALAYAQVYAGDDAELRASVARVDLKAGKKKPGRKPKGQVKASRSDATPKRSKVQVVPDLIETDSKLTA